MSKPKKRILQKRICDLEGCSKTFIATSHNRRFCDKAHTRLATNKRLLERYHEKKKGVKSGRICASDECDTVLSVYNPTPLCNLCKGRGGIV